MRGKGILEYKYTIPTKFFEYLCFPDIKASRIPKFDSCEVRSCESLRRIGCVVKVQRVL